MRGKGDCFVAPQKAGLLAMTEEGIRKEKKDDGDRPWERRAGFSSTLKPTVDQSSGWPSGSSPRTMYGLFPSRQRRSFLACLTSEQMMYTSIPIPKRTAAAFVSFMLPPYSYVALTAPQVAGSTAGFGQQASKPPCPTHILPKRHGSVSGSRASIPFWQSTTWLPNG